MKPRIGIPIPNSDRKYSDRVFPDYASAVEAAGGTAIEIDIDSPPAQIAQMLKSCDGILLPGSPADVDPEKYGAQRHPRTSAADPARDDADELALQDAYNMRKPILAICYGVQSLNVWRTGTLVQHLETLVQHSRPERMSKTTAPMHEAAVTPGTRLEKIVRSATGREGAEITINSSHHQSVADIGDELAVAAVSPRDGVIEALEGTVPEHFVLGVQWHPERMWQQDPTAREIFRTFVEEARTWRQQRAPQLRDFETLNS